MRRVAAALAAALLATARATVEQSLLDRAMAAGGSEANLRRARVLAWRGTAVVHAGGRTVRIGVDTVVEPFDYARSESWPLDEPARRAVLLIEGGRGWIIRDGRTAPMPATMLRHERQQFALYGLMRVVTWRDPGVSLAHVPAYPVVGLVVRHPRAPPTTFTVGGVLWSAANTVADPEGGPDIAQTIAFGGSRVDRASGVRWPRRIVIEHNGQPYFQLDVTHFAAAPTRAAIEPMRAAWR